MLIVCNGMMRSGSTLQYNLVRLLISQNRNGIAHGFFEAKDLDTNLIEKWANSNKIHLLKTHDLHPSISELALGGTNHVMILYIYRDIRDIAMSAMRVFKYETKASLYVSLDVAIDTDIKIRKLDCAIIERYEDFVINTHDAVSRYADLLGLNVTDCDIEQVVMQCLPKNLSRSSSKKKKVEKMTSFFKCFLNLFARSKYIHDPITLLHDNHISSNYDKAVKLKTSEWSLDNLEIQNKYKDWLSDRGYM